MYIVSPEIVSAIQMQNDPAEFRNVCFPFSQRSRTLMPFVSLHIEQPASSDSYRRDATVSRTNSSFLKSVCVKMAWFHSLAFSQCSASDRHIQCDWGGAGRWSERDRGECRHLCDQTGELGVLAVQPAQQAPAHHAHHQPTREHRSVNGILAGGHWQVTTATCGSLRRKKCVFGCSSFACWHPVGLMWNTRLKISLVVLCKIEDDTCYSVICVCVFVSVGQTAVWRCSLWRRCFPRCVEGNW